MGLFNFKNPLKNKQNPDTSSYLSLTITTNNVIACVWHFDEENVKVLATSEKTFSNQENLIHEAAVAIDTAAEQARTDVSKVVFGLSSYWFEDGKLKSDASKMLKTLSADLELDAQAFVTLAIAINHLLKIDQVITPQAVLIGTFTDFCEIHFVKNNKIISTKTAGGEITDSKIIKLIDELKQENENLPAKIIMFGQGAEAHAAKLAHAPLEDIFVHEPKIEIFDDEKLAKSVAYAQAADILGHDPSPKAKVATALPEQKEHKKDELGFVEGEDILLTASEPTAVAGQLTPVVPPDPENYAVTFENSDNLKTPENSENSREKKHRRLPSFSVKRFIPKMLSFKKMAIGAGAAIILLIMGFLIAGQTLTAAQVLIKVNAKTQDFNFDAKIISGGSNDFAKGEVAGKIVTGTADGSQKAVATGSKKTGTTSKGQVKILNWDKQASKTFAPGTEVITKDGLKFKLDSELSVASRSATTPGEAKVAATAVEIGPKYNIASGVDLVVVGFDEVFYSGVTDTSFTGGDEKQSTVASADDLAKLEKALTDSLTEKAKNDLVAKTGGLKIYDEGRVVKISKKEFDKKLEEEASLINLNMSIDYQAIAFDENDLKKYLAELTNQKQQDNTQALPETIDIKEITIKRSKDVLTLSGKYEAGLAPKINTDDLKNKIAGKNVKDARGVIKAIGDVADVVFTFKPNIPFVDSLPRNKDKISFKIEST